MIRWYRGNNMTIPLNMWYTPKDFMTTKGKAPLSAVRVDDDLVRVLGALSTACGQKLHILCGYCTDYYAEKEHKRPAHALGRAVDFRIPDNVTVDCILNGLEMIAPNSCNIGFNIGGRRTRYVHFEVTKKRARWVRKNARCARIPVDSFARKQPEA